MKKLICHCGAIEAEINLDKSIIQKMMNEAYQEACEMV